MTTATEVRRADVCCVAIAECFRGDGEIVANPIGTIPRIGGLLARRAIGRDAGVEHAEAGPSLHQCGERAVLRHPPPHRVRVADHDDLGCVQCLFI
jgi:hypothetical protein